MFSSVPVDDLFDDNVEGINLPNLIRPRVEVEDVDSDDENDDDYIESVNAPSNNLGGGQVDDENTEAAAQSGCGTRIRNPPDYYQADHSNIRYSYSNEADVINTCFQGAGYRAKDEL